MIYIIFYILMMFVTYIGMLYYYYIQNKNRGKTTFQDLTDLIFNNDDYDSLINYLSIIFWPIVLIVFIFHSMCLFSKFIAKKLFKLLFNID